MAKAAIIGRVELFIMGSLSMEKEMGMVYGNPMQKNTIFMKVTTQMIKNMEKVCIDGQMGLFMMGGLSKT